MEVRVAAPRSTCARGFAGERVVDDPAAILSLSLLTPMFADECSSFGVSLLILDRTILRMLVVRVAALSAE
jgi:hypothetical protein